MPGYKAGGIIFPWYTTNFTSSTTTTWNQWVSAGTQYSTTDFTNATAATNVWGSWNEWHEPVMYQFRRTEEETRRLNDLYQRQREERNARWLAERQRLEGAQDRALVLLDELVPERERPLQDLIEVLGSDGHLYRIELHRNTVHGNILQVDEHGCVLGRACVAPRMYDEVSQLALPLADGWVGQYLGLKFDAENFLRVANWSGRRPCQQPGLRLVA